MDREIMVRVVKICQNLNNLYKLRIVKIGVPFGASIFILDIIRNIRIIYLRW